MDTLLGLVANLVAMLAELADSTRRHWRCVRCKHWMRQMSDGPTCAQCGTFWPWRD